MSTFFLGIDSGTQSTKAIVLDFETGKIVASAHRKYDLIEGLPAGHLEQNPADWIKAVDESVARVRREARRGQGKSRGHRRQRPAARARGARREGRSSAPGEALVRHLHLGAVRRHRP